MTYLSKTRAIDDELDADAPPLADQLAALVTCRDLLKATVIVPLQRYLALHPAHRTPDRYFRDVTTAPFDIAQCGLATTIATDADGLWRVSLAGSVGGRTVRIGYTGASLAFTIAQAAERTHERLDRLAAVVAIEQRKAAQAELEVAA